MTARQPIPAAASRPQRSSKTKLSRIGTRSCLPNRGTFQIVGLRKGHSIVSSLASYCDFRKTAANRASLALKQVVTLTHSLQCPARKDGGPSPVLARCFPALLAIESFYRPRFRGQITCPTRKNADDGTRPAIPQARRGPAMQIRRFEVPGAESGASLATSELRLVVRESCPADRRGELRLTC